MLDETDFGAPLLTMEERTRLINDAADALDGELTYLGENASGGVGAGDVARAFLEDRAAVGEPELRRLDVDAVTRAGVPVKQEELTRLDDYYWLAIPVSLWTRSGHAFNRLQVRVSLNEGASQGRPIVINALPDHDLVTKFAVGSELNLAVRGDLSLDASLPEIPLDAIGIPAQFAAGAQVDAHAEADVVLGPLRYEVRVPDVFRTGLGMADVCWRLERAAFVDENDPGLRLVVAVPRAARRLEVTVQIAATRYVVWMGSSLKQALADLPRRLADFFDGGTLIAASGHWDLSGKL